MRIAFSAAVVVCLLVYNARSIALASVHGYQHAIAPLVSRAGIQCRFTPSCSRYAEAVIARDGVLRGGLKSLKRIVRCGPWTAAGTVDEP